jgi:hypothetical protein
VDAAMARRRRQRSDINNVVLVFGAAPSRHNKSGHAGRDIVHMRWIAVPATVTLLNFESNRLMGPTSREQ